MSDDEKRIARQEDTVVSDSPPPTYTPYTPYGGVPVADHVVSRRMSESVSDPAATRLAVAAWLSNLIWFAFGLLDLALVTRFLLLAAGANARAGFAVFVYRVTDPFMVPFAGLFGRPVTYRGTAGLGIFSPETLVAILVYSVIAWAIVKVVELLLSAGHNQDVVITDVEHHARV